MQFRIGGGVVRIKNPQTIVLLIVLTILTLFVVFSHHDQYQVDSEEDILLQKRKIVRKRNAEDQDQYANLDDNGAGDDKDLLLEFPAKIERPFNAPKNMEMPNEEINLKDPMEEKKSQSNNNEIRNSEYDQRGYYIIFLSFKVLYQRTKVLLFNMFIFFPFMQKKKTMNLMYRR